MADRILASVALRAEGLTTPPDEPEPGAPTGALPTLARGWQAGVRAMLLPSKPTLWERVTGVIASIAKGVSRG